MSGSLIPLAFDGAQIRASDNDTTLFVAEDVCAALGITKHRDAVAKLDDDERGSLEVDTLGGRQTVAAVTEAGVYTLALRCRDAMKPGTPPYRFRKWVTGIALPALRRGHEPGVIHGVDRETMKALGGMMKGIVQKQLQDILPTLVQAEVMSGRYSVIEGISALEVAELAGYKVGKRPKGTSQFISRRCGRYHEDRGAPVNRSRHGSGKVRLFDEAVARQWLRAGGQTEVDHYIAKRKGQGSLSLVR